MIEYYGEYINEDDFVRVVLKHSDVMGKMCFDDYDVLYENEDIMEYILDNYENYLELYLKYKDY